MANPRQGRVEHAGASVLRRQWHEDAAAAAMPTTMS